MLILTQWTAFFFNFQSGYRSILACLNALFLNGFGFRQKSHSISWIHIAKKQETLSYRVFFKYKPKPIGIPPKIQTLKHESVTSFSKKTRQVCRDLVTWLRETRSSFLARKGLFSTLISVSINQLGRNLLTFQSSLFFFGWRWSGQRWKIVYSVLHLSSDANSQVHNNRCNNNYDNNNTVQYLCYSASCGWIAKAHPSWVDNGSQCGKLR